MYYLVDWRINEKAEGIDLAELDVIPDTDVPWSMGMYWEEVVEQPIMLELDVDYGRDMPDAFFIGIPLFSSRFLDILYRNGVDNIQTYDAIIRDPRDDAVYDNYKAVNIVGMVACADLDKSTYIEGSGPPLMFFENLVIKDDIGDDLKIFRSAESADVIINDEIAKSIIDSHLVGIHLVKLAS